MSNFVTFDVILILKMDKVQRVSILVQFLLLISEKATPALTWVGFRVMCHLEHTWLGLVPFYISQVRFAFLSCKEPSVLNRWVRVNFKMRFAFKNSKRTSWYELELVLVRFWRDNFD
jgi:hypothetical protein